MAIHISQAITATGASEWMRVDSVGDAGAKFLLVVDLESSSGCLVDLEFAVQDVLDSDSLAIQHNILKDLDESTASTLAVPATGFRLNVKKYGAGTVNLRIIQHEE
jgi:hypothetical protein